MKQYKEKEILIFNAVYDLLSRGKNIQELVVQEIATQANIAKGSLYEYFDNKEDILQKSLEYFINENLIELIEKLQKVHTFEEKLFHILKVKCSKYEINHILLQNIDQKFNCKSKLSEKLLEQVDVLAEELIKCGVSEGVISKDLTKEYQKFILFSGICSYQVMWTIKNTKQTSSQNSEEDIKNVITMVKKSLA